MPPLEIRGPTVTLRLPRPDDADALRELASDPDVTRFFSWGPYRDRREPAAYLESLPGRRDRGELLDLAITTAAGAPIGISGLSELSRRDRRATIGTWLGRDHWGTGANRESKALMTALAFGPLGLERLTAYAGAGNVRSQAALGHIGFVREGLLREYHRHGETIHDVAIFSLLRSEWEAGGLSDVPAAISGDMPAAFVVG